MGECAIERMLAMNNMSKRRVLLNPDIDSWDSFDVYLDEILQNEGCSLLWFLTHMKQTFAWDLQPFLQVTDSFMNTDGVFIFGTLPSKSIVLALDPLNSLSPLELKLWLRRFPEMANSPQTSLPEWLLADKKCIRELSSAAALSKKQVYQILNRVSWLT